RDWSSDVCSSDLRDVAAARLGEREVTVVEVELDTLLDVRRSYLRLARLRREEAVLAAAAAASGQIVGWVKGLEEAGEADPVAVFLARAEDDELHAELERVRSHAARERRALLATVGLLPDAPVEPVL